MVMKKAVVFISFLAGAICFISAGLYINKQNSGLEFEKPQEVVTKVKSPELLSEIDMPAYVSLPASFADINITENLDNIEITEENVSDIMYDKLFRTAKHLATLDDSDKLIVADYTITKDGEVKEVKSDAYIGYENDSSLYDEKMFDELQDAAVGVPLHIENVTFSGISNAIVDITITDIFDMPYPVTDEYISENTEYENVYDMRATLMNDSSGEAKKIAREHTIKTLIDTMMNQTTFIKLPDSLIMKELEAIQKEEPNATYEDAKKSLYKVFFIAAMIDNYDIATKTDMEKRFESLDESEKEDLSDYEIERKKYMLFEEDVVTCLYKRIDVTNQD